MQESGVDLSYDQCTPSITTQSQARQHEFPTSLAGRSTRMQGLCTTRRMALMKQQDEQTSLSPDRQPTNEQPASQRAADLQQRIRDRLQIREPGVVMQTRIAADNVAHSLGSEQRPRWEKQFGINNFSMAPDRGAVAMQTSYNYSTVVDSAGIHQGAMSAPPDGYDVYGANVKSPYSFVFSSTATSLSEQEDVLADIERIYSMESEQAEAETSIHDLMLDTWSYHEGLVTEHQTNEAMPQSASCPAMPMIPLQPAMRIAIPIQQDTKPYRGGRRKEEPPLVFTEAQLRAYERERVKKDTHNDIEKRRREKINEHIQELATLVPAAYDLDLQNKKGTILQASVDYIKKLQKDQTRMKKMEEERRELEKKNRQLMLQIQGMMQNAQLHQQQPQPQQLELQQQMLQQRMQQQLVRHTQQPLPQQPTEQQQHLQQLTQQQLLKQQNQQQLQQQQHLRQEDSTEHVFSELSAFDEQFDATTFDAFEPIIDDLMDVGCQEFVSDYGPDDSLPSLSDIHNYLPE